jgi:hypothetical protein
VQVATTLDGHHLREEALPDNMRLMDVIAGSSAASLC